MSVPAKIKTKRKSHIESSRIRLTRLKSVGTQIHIDCFFKSPNLKKSIKAWEGSPTLIDKGIVCVYGALILLAGWALKERLFAWNEMNYVLVSYYWQWRIQWCVR